MVAAVSLTGSCGVPHRLKTVLAYSAKVSEMMARLEGRMTMTEVQAYRKATALPNASRRYWYSPPVLPISVPSSE